MNRLIILTILFLSFLKINSQAAHVNVLSGLNLRQLPTTKSKIITKLSYKTNVSIISTTEKTYTLGAFEGKWLKVKTNDGTGYLVDLFLTELPLPDLNDQSLLHDFLKKHLNEALKYEKKDNLNDYTFCKKYNLSTIQLIDFYFLLRVFHERGEYYLPAVLEKKEKTYSNETMSLTVTYLSNHHFQFEWTFDGGTTNMELIEKNNNLMVNYCYFPD